MIQSPGPSESQNIGFDKILDALIRRRLLVIGVWILCTVGAALYAMPARPKYQTYALLNIEKERGGGVIFSNGAIIEAKNDDYYFNEYKLLQSHTLLQTVHRELKLENHPDLGGPYGVDRLTETISIAAVPRSRLVYVKVTCFEPELAARIANTLSETFVNENFSNQLFISKDILPEAPGPADWEKVCAEVRKSPPHGVSGVSGNRLRAPGPLPPRLTSRSSAGRPLAEVPLTGLSLSFGGVSVLSLFLYLSRQSVA